MRRDRGWRLGLPKEELDDIISAMSISGSALRFGVFYSVARSMQLPC